MDGRFQKMARSLAILAASVAAGSGNATAALAAIPEEMITDFVESEPVESWEPVDRRRLASLLVADARQGVRKLLVKQVTRCPLPLAEADEDWLKTLAADPAPEVRRAFASGLRDLLERASPLERTYVVTGWALSPVELVRLAIARAVTPFEAIGVRTAIEHLSRDPGLEIRSAALEAERRLRTG